MIPTVPTVILKNTTNKRIKAVIIKLESVIASYIAEGGVSNKIKHLVKY